MNYIVVWALKMRLRLKNAGIRTVAGRVRYSRVIIRHEIGRMAAPGELCQTASAIRAEAAGVTLKPLPLRRSAGWSHHGDGLSACLIWRTQSARRGWKIKPAHHLQIKNCSAQITLMKYLSSLTGEISILMAHQAQLSQIMKIHLHCQSTAVQRGRVGLAPSRLAWAATR